MSAPPPPLPSTSAASTTAAAIADSNSSVSTACAGNQTDPYDEDTTHGMETISAKQRPQEEAAAFIASAYDPAPQLPFFPTAVYELLGSVVSVWWFELDFSQSTYGQHSSCHSNACTLIACLSAACLARRHLQLGGVAPPTLSHAMVTAFAESILLGNRIYCDLAEAGRLAHHNLNVPEAMEATAAVIGEHIEEWKSFVFLDDMGRMLFNCLSEGLASWWTENQGRPDRRGHVFVILIAENRSILLVFQQNPGTIAVFDSHQHSTNAGSCIAQTDLDQLFSLCQWIKTLFADIYNVKPKCFELSYIQSRGAVKAE